MQAQVTARKWGNSLGVTLPRQIVEGEGIKENEKLVIEVRRGKPAKIGDFFGIAHGWKIDAQKVKDEARRADLEHDRKISGLLRAH